MSIVLDSTSVMPRYWSGVTYCFSMVVVHTTCSAGSRSRSVPSVVGETSPVLT